MNVIHQNYFYKLWMIFKFKKLGIRWIIKKNSKIYIKNFRSFKIKNNSELNDGAYLIKLNHSLISTKILKIRLQTIKLARPVRMQFIVSFRRIFSFCQKYKSKFSWKIYPFIFNIIAVADLGIGFIDLRDIAERFHNVEFNPKKKSVCLYIRLRNPRATILLFTTGTITVTGCNSELASLIACRKIARKLQKIGYTTSKLISFNIKTVSGLSDLGYNINLESFFKYNSNTSFLDKEFSSNCIFYFLHGKCEITTTGKFIYLGISSVSEFFRISNKMYRIVSKFQLIH